MTIDALLDDEFEFESPTANNCATHYVAIGSCTWLALAAIALVLCGAWCFTFADWLQPTMVGLLWASLFLIGAAAGKARRGSGAFALTASLFVWFGRETLQRLTNLQSAESTLIAVILFGAGWFIANVDASAERNDLTNPLSSARTTGRSMQWTIWDLALLTTLCAFICYAAPRLESSVLLLYQVFFVLAAGLLCSWIAFRWVFDDHWSLSKLFLLTAGCAACVSLIGAQSPTEFSLLQIAAWMITGPLAVIAAQGLTVLTLLTIVRLDQGSLSSKTPTQQIEERRLTIHYE